MTSSGDPGTDAGQLVAGQAVAELGEFLTGTEARAVARRLADGATVTAALNAVPAQRRSTVRRLFRRAGLGAVRREETVLVLQAIAGAHSVAGEVVPLWTMPGHLARSAPLTSSVAELVTSARYSVTCSTYNFQRSSALWQALGAVAERPGLAMTVYMDARVADQEPKKWSPTSQEVAEHLQPATVYRSKEFSGKYVLNHAKFVVVDHRFVLVTSANFSRSAEEHNVELGLRLDDAGLAELIEEQMLEVRDVVYERVLIGRFSASGG